ncbi:MAG: AIPR family protein [Defluviitaleaceae bacterium]|nr:AIPR family protein [Defluviitaleaceae bacterium]
MFGDKYFQESVALCLMFRYAETMVPQQDWYQQGYRANIVTYTIALLHKLIKTQFPKHSLDLMGIWTRQTIPNAVKIALAELAELVYIKLTDPSRQIENVTQWCKREACWNNVQTVQYALVGEMQDCLITQDELRSVVSDAKVGRRIEKEVDEMTKVVEIQADQWHSIMNFAMNKKMVSTDELVALRIACQLPSKIPNPVQNKKLLGVLDRVYEEGFKL